MKIRHWYKANYPSDALGNEISEDATFEGLYNNLEQTYEYLNVADSVIRERIFERLAEFKRVKYDVIYERWLNSI
jgi:hypothetical protein